MSREVRLRAAVRDDVPAIRSLLAELGYRADSVEAAFEAILSRDDHRICLADFDGRAVGYALAHVHVRLGLGAPMVSLDELVVTKDMRGRGVGTALLAGVRTWAHEVGAARIELITARDLESYRSGFYAKRGLREVDSAVLRGRVER